MGVSISRGTPKWMVFVRENPMKMDDLGVPLFQETFRLAVSAAWPSLIVVQGTSNCVQYRPAALGTTTETELRDQLRGALRCWVKQLESHHNCHWKLVGEQRMEVYQW